jgi:hypothetical protein
MTTAQFREKYGPYALIAGGSYGLGSAFAEAIAKRGVNVILVARGEDRLRETSTRLRQAHGVDVIAIAADMADYETVKKRVEALEASIGLLVYNAAYAPIGLFEDTSEDRLALAVDVNVRTPMLLTRLLTAPMIRRKTGGVVLMSSLAGSQGGPNISTYVATKAFNAILAEGLWKELGSRGIDVIACCAGAILTPGYRQAEQTKPAPGTLEAHEVAEQTLKALGRGPFVVPGTINKIGRFVLTRLVSKRAAIGIMAKNTSGLS